MAKKTNPKKIPRSQRDVDDAYEIGICKGVEATAILMVLGMYDCGVDPDLADRIVNKFVGNVDGLYEGRIKLYDVKTALEEEYSIQFSSLLKPFGYKNKF